MTRDEFEMAQDLGLFKGTFTPGNWRAQPGPNGDDAVIIPDVSGSERHNDGKIIAHLHGPDAMFNARRIIEWHNAQQELEN